MCNSHYGALQVFHAMRSARDEEAAQTHRRILAWALFAYEVATGAVDTDQPYCATIRTRRMAISDDLAPSGFAGCEARRVNGRAQVAWTVGTLFAQQCSDPIFPSNCRRYTGAEGRRFAQEAALGAVLHLVQDSYSQSHAIRGPALSGGHYEARVDCHWPTGYIYYDKTSKVHHIDADTPPRLDAGCGPQPPPRESAQADDVITASARVVRYARSGASSEALKAYLETRVFGPEPA